MASLTVLRKKLFIGLSRLLGRGRAVRAQQERQSHCKTKFVHRALATGDASFFISFSISAMVEGFRSGAFVARNTPSAHTIGVLPSLSLTFRRAPCSTRNARISSAPLLAAPNTGVRPIEFAALMSAPRSEERRVGPEC